MDYLEGDLGMAGKVARKEWDQDKGGWSRSQILMGDSEFSWGWNPSPKVQGFAQRGVGSTAWWVTCLIQEVVDLEKQWAFPWFERSTLGGGDWGLEFLLKGCRGRLHKTCLRCMMILSTHFHFPCLPPCSPPTAILPSIMSLSQQPWAARNSSTGVGPCELSPYACWDFDWFDALPVL